MISITLIDGSTQEIIRDEVKGIYPYRNLMRNPHLKSDALIYQAGRLIPVFGPLAEPGAENLSVSERPWLMLFETHAQMVRGFPKFSDDVIIHVVPSREISAPVLVEAPSTGSEDSFEAAPSLVNFTETNLEEDEEAKLLRELEDLVKAA